MEVGYLGPDGSLVVVDTMGRRTLFDAYRVSERDRAFSFLGRPRPMEPLGEVRASVWFHRGGFGKPGEAVLSPIPARLYRTRTSHLVLGESWRAIRMPRRGKTAVVHHPYGSDLKDLESAPGISPPADTAPAIVVIGDNTVKACQRSGKTVHLFGTEQKEFLDFVLGKVSVTLDFPTEAHAEAFAASFPGVREPKDVDPTIVVDVDRSRKFVWSRKVLTVGWRYFLYLIVAEGALIALALRLGRFGLLQVGFLSAGLALAAFLFVPSYLRQFRREAVDLEGKWPRVALERWTREGSARAGAYLHWMRELGLDLDPEDRELAVLDSFIRAQPPRTYFRGFAMETSAYLGELAMASLGREVPHHWRYDEGYGDVVLEMPAVDYWIAPIVAVARTWLSKDPKPLGAWVHEWAEDFGLRFAFQDATAFEALGFPYRGWADFEAFGKRIRADLATAGPPTTHVLNEGMFRVRRLPYPPFEIRVVDVEIEWRKGTEFRPVVAIPFTAEPQALAAALEGVSPRSPHREDVAIVRFEGYELAPVGVQIANYVEVGAGFPSSGRLELRLQAVADAARVLGPRARQLLADAKDFLAPMRTGAEELPAGPYARVLGRIREVSETLNPVAGIPLWRVAVDVGGLVLTVTVRKDRCDGIPAVGHHLQGDLWLAADVRPVPTPPSPYIR